MPWRGPQAEGEVPTLGWEVVDWIQANCVIPDGDYQGDPFVLSDEQRDFVLDLYAVHPDALERLESDVRRRPNRAFVHNRGGLFVAPQKHGKGPLAAALVCAEAAGPVLFDGWSAAGEPVGRSWATPLVAITAQSEDQGKNVWDALLWMIRLGPLEAEFQVVTGDRDAVGLSRINLPNGGRIDPVTSSARSRQGARVTYAVQDEVQSWLEANKGHKLADTQYRSLAGMGGRFLQTCNAWDPAERSVAQETWEAGVGVAKYMVDAGPGNVRNRRERERALRRAYQGAPWAPLELISDTIDDFIARGEVAQAERFFLNRVVAAEDRAVEPAAWEACRVEPREVSGATCTSHPRADRFHERSCGRALVTVGVDGARYIDSLAIVATEVETGYQWPLGIWERPPNAPDGYEHPLEEVDAVLSEAFEAYNVWRAYVDPGSQVANIEVLLQRWEGRYGKDRAVEWRMDRYKAAAVMVREYVAAVVARDVQHGGDPDLARHVANARRRPLTYRDEDGGLLWTVRKEFPGSPNKIDAFAAAALSWKARGDALTAGVARRGRSAYEVQLCRCDRTPGPETGHLRQAACPR